jgi:hypothetical protein
MSNQKQLIDFLESSFETPLEISNTYKYAFFNKGIGLRTANKIVNWLRVIPFPWKDVVNRKVMAKIIRSSKVGSNAASWFSAISGFQHSQFDKEDNEFGLLIYFIDERCNAEVDLLLRVKGEIEAGNFTSDDISAIWRVQQSLWANKTFISQSVFNSFSDNMLKHKRGEKLTELETLSSLECYFYLYFDFYIEAITHYEIGLRLLLGRDKAKSKEGLGALTKAITAYATGVEIKTCFAGLLAEFKELSSKLVGETSYRKLATFIEINDVEPSEFGEKKEDKQYKQLKDWRNGKNLPSDKKLSAFLQNLDTYANTSSGSYTFDMCKVALGVDKIINNLMIETKNENCKKNDVEILIRKVLSNVPDYYQVNLSKALEKREPT